jgi:hypothetical protein
MFLLCVLGALCFKTMKRIDIICVLRLFIMHLCFTIYL